MYRAHKFKQAWVRGAGEAKWGTWLDGKGKEVSFVTVLKKLHQVNCWSLDHALNSWSEYVNFNWGLTDINRWCNAILLNPRLNSELVLAASWCNQH